ncbi:MAG: alpha/beta hydrolase [Thermoplasmata archaeon]
MPAIERGEGRPVVFLHGYPLSHEIWLPQLETLSARDRVVLLDLPGYGLARDWPVPDSLSGFAESVHQTFARQFTSPVVVVGHSFGGYVALELFRNHPEQFQAIVLTNTRSEPDGVEAREKRLATAKRLEDPSQFLDIEGTIRGLFSPRTGEAAGPLLETARTIVRNVPSRTIIGTLKAIAGRSDLTPVLSTIHVPALVIWGEEDRLIPPAQSRSMVARIPGSSGVGIPEAGHLPSLEAPEAFARTLNGFLDRLPSV